MSIQNDEKVAIKTYCTVARQIEQAKMAFSRDIREQKAQVDANRANLFELMKATGIECMPFDGGYARIKVNNSMRAVTKDVVSDALQLLTREMVEEEKSNNPESSARDVLVGCILKLIQSRRTKSKEFVEFSKFKPKNFNLSNQRSTAGSPGVRAVADEQEEDGRGEKSRRTRRRIWSSSRSSAKALFGSSWSARN